MSENETEGSGAIGRQPTTTTNLAEVLDDLNGGVFAEQVGRALSDVALGVVNNGDKKRGGKVTITFDMSRIGESTQVAVKHTLAFSKPTSRGKAGEESSGETPMHVGRGGKLTLVPDTQTRFEFDRG